jgi:hypothetical protein
LVERLGHARVIRAPVGSSKFKLARRVPAELATCNSSALDGLFFRAV